MKAPEQLKNWTVSEYNENTKDQLDYYINKNKCNAGDTAYLYSHADDTLTELTIVKTIRRSDNMEYYDNNLDEDVLLWGEDAYNADTSAEFITDDDCYLIWFQYTKTKKIKCKVRLTYSVEMVVEGESKNAIMDWLERTTPSKAKTLTTNRVKEDYKEEILYVVDDATMSDYNIP